MAAKIKRSPRVSRRPLTIAEKLATLRAALLRPDHTADARETKNQPKLDKFGFSDIMLQ